MSRWKHYIPGERGRKVVADDSVGKVHDLKEAYKKNQLKLINQASKDFFPRLSTFYSKWGYNITLKILAGYAAKLIAQSKDRERDTTQFVQLVKHRIRYFENEK